MNAWTLVGPGQGAQARLLAERLAEHHPGVSLRMVIAGAPVDVPGAETTTLAETLPGIAELVTRAPFEVLADVARAAVLQLALARAADEAVLVVDAAMEVYAPLDPLLNALSRRAIAIVPRLREPPPNDEQRPDRDDVDLAGLHSSALIVARPGGEADEFARWWLDRALGAARAAAPVDPDEWRRPRRRLAELLELGPSLSPALSVVCDPGLGVSAWNLHERRLERGADGAVRVDGVPLRAFHFAEFDPTRPYWLSASADRVRVPGDSVLEQLCTERARRLLAAGWRDVRAEIGTALPNGFILDARAARLLEQGLVSGELTDDVVSPEGADAFVRWLAEPVGDGRLAGLNRYLLAVYAERPDFVGGFGDLADAETFVAWVHEHGRHEEPVPAGLMPGGDGRVDADTGGGPHRLPSVRVSGFLRGTLGLGAAARLYLEAVGAAGLPATTHTVTMPGAPAFRGRAARFAEVEFADVDGGAQTVPDVDLVCVNADELPAVADQLAEGRGPHTRTIGVWAWETDHIPERWHRAYGLVDEIWTYTRYVAESISRVSPLPVIPIPIPVPIPATTDAHLDLGLPPGFRFLFIFDFLSTSARKNPGGLIEAFTRAFRPGEGPQLVLKSLHGDLRPANLDQLRWLSGDRPDIHLVDRNLSLAERDALMAGCDAYVSLHRAEGFGLTMAEAMGLGKPVIATAYSGNTDFMTPTNSYLVDYELTRVGPHGEQYPPEGVWADPDLDHAAALMRRVVERPDEARTRGERARRDVERQLSPEAVGRLIRDRLLRLRAHGGL